MARRRLLTEDQWARLLAVPDDERAMVRHYTLGRDDLDIVALRRTPHTRLGCAVLLCYPHHPARIPGPAERPPAALLPFVAQQVAADPDNFIACSRRNQNRREQVAVTMARTGHRPFDRALFRDLAAWLTSKCRRTECLLPIPRQLIEFPEVINALRVIKVCSSSSCVDAIAQVPRIFRGNAFKVRRYAVGSATWRNA